MGFRSTIVSTSAAISWPEWFREKYAPWLGVSDSGVLYSHTEAKLYGSLANLTSDIRESIDWSRLDFFAFVCVHECGGISRCVITRQRITWTEPTDWDVVSEPSHWYCIGCETTAAAPSDSAAAPTDD